MGGVEVWKNIAALIVDILAKTTMYLAAERSAWLRIACVRVRQHDRTRSGIRNGSIMPVIHHGKKISIFGDFESIKVIVTDMEPLKFRDIYALHLDLAKWVNENIDNAVHGYEKAGQEER